MQRKARAIVNEFESVCVCVCVCVCTEWSRSVVMQFAAKAQEAHSQFAVPVVSANSGGLVVRSQYFRGKVTHRFGQERQYIRCNIACCNAVP